MQILLTNDDGLEAHGLQRALTRLRKHHEVIVYAPAANRSGASHSITLRAPVAVKEVRSGEFSVVGTPADSVYLAISHGLRPDLVISGINAGANLGCDTLYSGTVAAAMESRFLSVPAIAVSLCCAAGDRADHVEYETACDVLDQLIGSIDQWRSLPMSALNVNVPACSGEDLQGMRWTRLGRRGQPLPAKPWPGKSGAWEIGLAGDAIDVAVDTDFHAIDRGFVSLTPLQQDLTSIDALSTALQTSPDLSL